MRTLKSLGSEQTKKVLTRHGAKEPFYGVKVEDLKKIQKKIKINDTLAKELYETGNSDAMYLAGLIADPTAMTKSDLNNWAKKAEQASGSAVRTSASWARANSNWRASLIESS